jgi:hypothetical protein
VAAAQELARKVGAAVPTCAATSEMLNTARSTPVRDRDFLVSVHDVTSVTETPPACHLQVGRQEY